MKARTALPLSLAGLIALAPPALGEPLDHIDPVTGYRTARYQAAVPQQPPAGTRVWIDDIDTLIAGGDVLLLDVSPIHGAGYDATSGRWRLSKPHATLPGAVWLPEVGRGHIDRNIERYLSRNLEALTRGDKHKPIIIFCHADCWMSWNAMKRIARLGYSALKWFPEGTDGWRDFDRALVAATPVPLDTAHDITPDGGGGSR
ncbi:MAG: rhodanese-like domain-containing protein [Hyphomicrobiaceae bacterium]